MKSSNLLVIWALLLGSAWAEATHIRIKAGRHLDKAPATPMAR